MLVEPSKPPMGRRIYRFLRRSRWHRRPYLSMPAGGSRHPASAETVENKMHYVHQEGQQVFKYAVTKMQEVSTALLARNGLTPPTSTS